MSVEFDEQTNPSSYGANRFSANTTNMGGSKMAAWLIKRRIAKSEKSANIILLAAAILMLAISAIIIFTFVL